MNGPLGDLTRKLVAVLFMAGLILASLWILSPFLPALAWATLLVVSTWPVLGAVQARLWRRRGLAVVVMTSLQLLLVILPIALTIATLVQNAGYVVAGLQVARGWSVPAPPDWVESLPLAGERLAQQWRQIASMRPGEVAERIAPYSAEIARWIGGTAGSLALFFLHLGLTVILSAILYAKGEAAAAGVRAFARRLAGERGEHLTHLAGQAIRAVALGVIVTAFAQAVLAGIGLYAAGVPFAGFLTALAFVLAVAQVGAGPILILAIGWLYWKESTWIATAFLVWSLLVMTVDNVLRPILIQRGANLPLLLIFAGVIGGILGFGLIGIFVGPVVLAVAYTLLEDWMNESPSGG